MRTLFLISLFFLASCHGTNQMLGVNSSDGGSCGAAINSSWVDNGGAILDLTHLDLSAPVTSQWITSSGQYTCRSTFIVIGDQCAGTITVTGGSQVSGSGFTSSCRDADGTYTYAIIGGRLRYGKEGSSQYIYH